MFDRILKLITEEELKKIQNTKVLLIGLGGVGGYALEALLRSGFTSITVIDKDVFEESNLNRQLLATQSTLGLRKVEVAQERALEIANIKIKAAFQQLTKEDITEDFVSCYDYIIDACDCVDVKVELIRVCSRYSKKLISSMGTANRMHPEMIRVDSLSVTKNDPLAKKIRTLLKREKKALKTKVVWSEEVPKKQKDLGTFLFVPMSAGSLLVSTLVNDLLKTK